MSDNNGSDRPEPVLDEAKIAGTVTGVVTALLGVAAVLGLVAADDTNTVVTAVVAVATGVCTIVNFVVPKWRAWRARNKVTPISDPRGAFGVVLVPTNSTRPL
jgi:fumarate reductase subunit D